MKTVLVVCEGNICRSPMAQGLIATAAPRLSVHSAGLSALSGMPADDAAVRLMGALHIDITSHRAVQITSEACQHADLVLAMTAEQRKLIEQRYPVARGRVFRIAEFSKRDVPDPYRRPEGAFREALALIDQGVREWLRRIDQI
jgi:protein-tyrosine phosphatase